MGIKEKIVILIMAFFCLCVPASSSPLGEFLPLDHLQGNMKHDVHLSNNYGGGSGIAHPNKIGHASGGWGGSRAAAVCISNPSGGRSQPSAAIPLYAAGAGGAANNHHNDHRNHSGSKTNYSSLKLVTFALTILACLLLLEDM
ncbi:hypothetical protein Pfo_027286 [Paulownia fortunei]|nr:hypothetical protein Pfo_027286 [Paulownia fortunei]